MPSLTRATLVTRIGQLIEDKNNTRFSSSEKQDRIQEAQEQFVLDTRVLTDNVTDTTVADQQEYSLQTDCFDIKRLAHKGIELRRISKFDLDLYTGQDWTDDKGTPKFYYVDLDPNNKKYGLYPIPQGGDTGANLAQEYIKIPPTLSADSSVPFDSHTLLTPYHEALAYYAAANLLMINPSEKSVKMAKDYMEEYKDLVSTCIETFKEMSRTITPRMLSGRYFK